MTFYSQGGGHFSDQQENTEQYVPPEQLVPGFAQATPNEQTAHFSQPLVEDSYEPESESAHHRRSQQTATQERDERWGEPGLAAGAKRAAEGGHRNTAHRTVSLNAVFGILAVICVGLGVFITEDGTSLWKSIHAWGVVAIVAALITAAPLVAGSGRLDAKRGWQVAAAGAAFLLLYWVLFILPGIGSNTSLLSSAGVAFGAAAAWLAPGRPTEKPSAW